MSKRPSKRKLEISEIIRLYLEGESTTIIAEKQTFPQGMCE